MLSPNFLRPFEEAPPEKAARAEFLRKICRGKLQYPVSKYRRTNQGAVSSSPLDAFLSGESN
jgi:hypothetical protein